MRIETIFIFYILWIMFFSHSAANGNQDEEEAKNSKCDRPMEILIHQFDSNSHAKNVQDMLKYDKERYWPMQWTMVVKVNNEEEIQIEDRKYTATMKIAEMHLADYKGNNIGVVIIGNTPVNFQHEDLRERFMSDSPVFSMFPKKSKLKELFSFKRKNVQICLPNTLSSAVAGIIGMTDLNSVGGVGVAPRCLLGHFVIDSSMKKGSPEYYVYKSLSMNADAVDVFVHTWILPFHDPLSDILHAWGDINLLNFRQAKIPLKPQVMGSGNFGLFANSCQCNEYANADSMFVFGSIAYNKFITSYSETCASLIGVTYSTSEGKEYYHNILTISAYSNNLLQNAPKDTTSISAAFGGGLIALMTDAFKKKFHQAPLITDIAFLLAFSSNSLDLDDKNMIWFTNGVNLRYSPQAGFGIPDMKNVINLLKNWSPLGFPIVYETSNYDRQINFHCTQKNFKRKPLPYINNQICSFNILNAHSHHYIQSIGIEINVKLKKRGALSVFLISPAGTVSCILEGRPYDVNTSKNYEKLYLRSYHFLGEKLQGKWIIGFYNYKVDSKPLFNKQFSFPTKPEINLESDTCVKPLVGEGENGAVASLPTNEDSKTKMENSSADKIVSAPVEDGGSPLPSMHPATLPFTDGTTQHSNSVYNVDMPSNNGLNQGTDTTFLKKSGSSSPKQNLNQKTILETDLSNSKISTTHDISGNGAALDPAYNAPELSSPLIFGEEKKTSNDLKMSDHISSPQNTDSSLGTSGEGASALGVGTSVSNERAQSLDEGASVPGERGPTSNFKAPPLEKSQKESSPNMKSQRKQSINTRNQLDIPIVNQVKFRALLVESLPISLPLDYKIKNRKHSKNDFHLLKSWVDFRHFLLVQTDPMNYGKSSVSMNEVYDLTNYFIQKLLKIQTELLSINKSNQSSHRIYSLIDEMQAPFSPQNNPKVNQNSPSISNEEKPFEEDISHKQESQFTDVDQTTSISNLEENISPQKLEKKDVVVK